MVSVFRTITKFLDKWNNIRGFIILSLFLQIILLLLTPFRKRSRSPIIRGPIWLAYVLATWAATFAIGLISSHQSNCPKPDDVRVDILAFWATFPLLYLSGPDNASALSIEDTSIWQRHLFDFIYQLLSTIFVFGQKLPRNKLLISTILVFVAGTIKNGERAYALYLAKPNFNPYLDSSIKRLPEPNPSSLPTKKDRFSNFEVVKCAYDFEEKRLSNVEVVKYAYDFVDMYKNLIMGFIPEDPALERSKEFFSKNDHIDAFRVLEVELNLIYEVFYTKVFMVYSMSGCVFRYIYWCAVVVALLIFSSMDKHGFRSIDLHITYTLLFGTMGLDAIALFMFATSEWVVIHMDKYLKDAKGSWRHSLCKCFLSLLEYLFRLKTIKWVSNEPKFCYFDWVRKLLFGFFYWVKDFLFSRSSRSLNTYNFIDYCLRERHKKNLNGNGYLREFYDSIKYVSKEPVEEELWKFIYTQLREKVKDGQHSSVGPSSYSYNNSNNEDEKLSSLDFGKDYHQMVLNLHIATDLCYEKNEDNESSNVDRKNSKALSDYMLYLQVMNPDLVFADLGRLKVRFADTSNHAKTLFLKYVPKMERQKRERAKAREECLEMGAKYERLSEVVALVKKLEKLHPSKRWKLISEVWMELLSYVASKSKADMHIARLNKGGEFITFVWLLMAHFELKYDSRSFEDDVKNILHKRR